MGLACCKGGCCDHKGLKSCNEYSKGQEGMYKCDGKCGRRNGSVWGGADGTPFTGDSSICAAAVYRGILSGDRPGIIRVKTMPGASEYKSGSANGVTTSSYGSYDSSMEVSRAGCC